MLPCWQRPRPSRAKEEEGRRIEEREADKRVPFVIVYRNRFWGPNLGAAIGMEAKKNEPTKVGGSTQIKSRGPDLGAPAGVALSQKKLKFIKHLYL
jgi:hypothetical protein